MLTFNETVISRQPAAIFSHRFCLNHLIAVSSRWPRGPLVKECNKCILCSKIFLCAENSPLVPQNGVELNYCFLCSDDSIGPSIKICFDDVTLHVIVFNSHNI